jgi:hypothetical protein
MVINITRDNKYSAICWKVEIGFYSGLGQS